MKSQEEIRLKRLATVEACRNFPESAWYEMLKDTPTGQLILTSVLKVGAVSDTLSWILNESDGGIMESAISETENLGRNLKTGHPFPKMTKDKALHIIKEAFEKGPELGKKIKKDQDELLKRLWDEFESEQ